MKVAIVHDRLVVRGGAEKVLEQLLLLYPEATLFSLVDFLPKEQRGFLQGKTVKTTFIQKLPFAKSSTYSLPFAPLAIEGLDLSSFDLIISSSYAVAKGVLIAPGQLHICYCHSPMRYIWDLQQQYLKNNKLELGFKSFCVRLLFHKLRLWDQLSSARVDYFVANSLFTASRIEKCYRRESTVIYPPLSLNRLPFREEKEEFYLTASRLVCYKRVDLIVEAFSQMKHKKLFIIGMGPEYKRLLKMKSSNIELLGYQSDECLYDYMSRASAFIFAAEEDFGITPLEAMACGTPVIAYGRGGTIESVVDLEGKEPTGLFFEEQTALSLSRALLLFEKNKERIKAKACLSRAMLFSEARFRKEFHTFVEGKIENTHFSGRQRNQIMASIT